VIFLCDLIAWGEARSSTNTGGANTYVGVRASHQPTGEAVISPDNRDIGLQWYKISPFGRDDNKP